MSKRFLAGVVLIGVAVLVLLLSGGGSIKLDFLVTEVKLMQSVALFLYLSAGVLIGFLLR